ARARDLVWPGTPALHAAPGLGVEDVHLRLREGDADGVALAEAADPLGIDAAGNKGVAEPEVGGGVAAGLFGVLHGQAEGAGRILDAFAGLAEMLGPQAKHHRLAINWRAGKCVAAEVEVDAVDGGSEAAITIDEG